MTDKFKSTAAASYLLISLLVPALGVAEKKAALRHSTAGRPGEAQSDTSVRMPLMGFLAHRPVEVRPIYGLPGAGLVGNPLQLPAMVGKLSLAPAQDYVVLERTDGLELSVMTLSALGTGAPIRIAGALSHADGIAFGGSGSVALL